MIEEDRLIHGAKQDDVMDASIRPRALDDYLGQSKVKAQMAIFLTAAKQRRESLDHTLIFWPPGLGKTTLAGIIASEMGSNLKTTSGPVLEKAGDLAALLTNLDAGDVFYLSMRFIV